MDYEDAGFCYCLECGLVHDEAPAGAAAPFARSGVVAAAGNGASAAAATAGFSSAAPSDEQIPLGGADAGEGDVLLTGLAAADARAEAIAARSSKQTRHPLSKAMQQQVLLVLDTQHGGEAAMGWCRITLGVLL